MFKNKKFILKLMMSLVCIFAFMFVATKKQDLALVEAKENVEDVTFKALDGSNAWQDREFYTCALDGKKHYTNYSGDSTKWCAYMSSNPYIVIEASKPVNLSSYIFYVGNDSTSGGNNRNPKSWTLYGSNDYDATTKEANWYVIDKVDNDTKMKDINYKGFTFNVENNYQYYKYYKFVFTKNHGASLMQLTEIEMMYTNNDRIFTILSGGDGTPGKNEGYYQLMDGTTDTKYYANTLLSQSNPEVLIFKSSEPTLINGYTLYTGGDTNKFPNRNPKNWKLYGGYAVNEKTFAGEWVLISEVKDGVMSTESKTGTHFDVTNNTYYNYYKLVVESTGGGNLQLSEIEFDYYVLASYPHPFVFAERLDSLDSIHAIIKYKCNHCNTYVYGTSCSLEQDYDTVNHWEQHSCCDIICGQRTPHTLVYDYDSDKHYYKCDSCDYIASEQEHQFTNDLDYDCNDENCDYKRLVDININYANYELDGKIGDFYDSLVITDNINTSIAGDCGLISNFNSADSSGYLGDSIIEPTEQAYFLPNKEYGLVVILMFDISFDTSKFTEDNFKIGGHGGTVISMDIFDDDTTTIVYAYVQLPYLVGESKIQQMPDIEGTLNGYEVDKMISDSTITIDTETYNYSDDEALVNFEIIKGNSTIPFDSTEKFTSVDRYFLEIEFLAKENCTFVGFSRNNIKLEDLGEPAYTYISASGALFYAYYYLPELIVPHTHNFATSPEFYDDKTHTIQCDICHLITSDEHVYGINPRRCDYCPYINTVYFESLDFTMTGYDLNGKIKNFKIKYNDEDENGFDPVIQWGFSTSRNYWDTEAIWPNDNGYFLLGNEYYLFVQITSYDGYDFSNLDFNQITLNGEILPLEAITETEYSAESLRSNGRTSLYLMFKLPTLEGEQTIEDITDITVYLDNYALENYVKDLVCTLDENSLEYITFTTEYYSSGRMNDGYDLIVIGSNYIDFIFSACDGYTFNNATYDDFKLIVNDTTIIGTRYFEKSPSGNEIRVNFNLPSLETNHEHTLSYRCNDQYHWEICIGCNYTTFTEKEEHAFVEKNGVLTCQICWFYMYMTTPISETNITISNYGYYKKFSELSVDISNNGIVQQDDYDDLANFMFLCKSPIDRSYFVEPSEFDETYFNENSPRYLNVMLFGKNGYYLDINDLEDVKVNIGTVVQLIIESDIVTVIIELPKLEAPHIHAGTWVDEVKATCLEQGTKGYYQCIQCKKYFDENDQEIKDLTIEPLDHDIKHAQAQDATCSQVGHYAYDYCSRCDYSTKEEIPTTEHTPSGWILDINGSCKEINSKHIECTECGKVLKVEKLDAFFVFMTMFVMGCVLLFIRKKNN